ncbi:SAM-dependent methyltransferase [Gordonia pseudamarae]|jgi:release factor glutamine methyltransferase|uniref:SAM-dependent methyltransferase n=1 Tax=Gordonia pseudamarae TaxID=2831662 RepID=A0ABX6IGN1_9ACTN|nr:MULTISPECIES: SAM-dependent methyltransferase [Gordonia]MBD0023365.1 SAM-dependent methyltransferase [Gordonia sp. (in: high G+C Gram-positive bacteria)]QHN25597.1 SAM-dependent methyltransferase [Gordonia pseudamarae]QHN34529.1 SAM-dependent methyltransferase [Gordonia pseudamarae]
MVRRREKGEPPEHIVGYVKFADLRLSVGPGVFIPRRRSAFVADLVIDACHASVVRPVVVEAYCGAAPIGAVVASRAESARLIAVDHSAVARRHARRNLPASARVVHGALPGAMTGVLAGEGVLGAVDVLGAVAPYVPSSRRDLLPAEALDHEPADSHDGGHDGLDAVRGLIAGTRRWCSADGVMLLECHRDQAGVARLYAQSHGLGCRVRHSHDGQTAVVEVRVARDHPPG